jgi:cyclopropane fatty-acyl-phospholipid synthase-like methyltransferase
MNRKVALALLILFTASVSLAHENALDKIEGIKLCQMDHRNRDAINYVGTRPSGGKAQLELLLLEGLQENDYVLEIGFGALMTAIPIMSFLETGHYAGIDPNKWLMEASLQILENRAVVLEKQPIFLYNYDFDGSSLMRTFDYIYAHSIMSHAAHWQLPLFLEKCAKVLKKGGKVLFSLRLTEINEYGNEGADRETQANEWVYPGVSFFHKETVIREASKWFSKVEHKKEFTKRLTEDSKGVYHDWFVLTK